MSIAIRRTLLLACCACSLVALGVSSASAAGMPKLLFLDPTDHEHPTLTHLPLRAEANPNGASTTAQIEVREEGAGAWTAMPSHNLGSGTAGVSYEENVHLLKPNTNYEVRMSATNEFGTRYLASTHKEVWSRWYWQNKNENKFLLSNAPYASTVGTASFNFSYVFLAIKVECNEWGSGTIGNPEGKGDSHRLEFENCSVYENGKKSATCKAKPFYFKLKGDLSVESAKFTIPLEGCPAESWPIAAEYFLLNTSNPGVMSTTQPVHMSATGKMLGSAATVSVDANWLLAGEYVGYPFRLDNHNW